MTDEQMDARLRAAGEAWRTANDRPTAMPAVDTAIPTVDTAMPAVDTANAAVDPATLLAPAATRSPRRHRAALLASAAVVATALVAGGAFLLGRTSDDKHRVTNTDDAATLQGTTWRLLGYDGDQRRVNSTATLYVDRHGQFVADDSCNLITGKVDSA